MEVREAAELYLINKGYFLTSNNGEHMTEAEAVKTFEAGANYVLKEIETIAKADLGSYKSQLDRIKELIEQLKK